MTPEELKAIEERAEKATPGPWTFDIDMDSVVADEWWNGEHSERTITTLPVQPVAVTDLQREATGQFIAAARTDIPALLAHIQAIEAQRDAAVDGENKAVEAAMEDARQHFERLQAIEASNKTLRGCLADIEEREAAVCPEDVGFDEYIRVLQAERDRMREQIHEAIKLIHADEPEGNYHKGMAILCELAGLRFPANEALKTARPMTIFEVLQPERKAEE